MVNYSWNNGAQTDQITVNESGMYILTVSDPVFQNCQFTDSVKIFISHLTNPFLDTTHICSDSTFILNALNDGATYAWNDGSTDSILVVDDTGLYSVDISNEYCVESYSTQVVTSDFMYYRMVTDTRCGQDNGTLLLQFQGGSGNYYGALNNGQIIISGTDSILIENLSEGIFPLEVGDDNCSLTDTVEIGFTEIPVNGGPPHFPSLVLSSDSLLVCQNDIVE